MRFYADCVSKYGEALGVVDITTRAKSKIVRELEKKFDVDGFAGDLGATPHHGT